jgi:signal transduction histidine kinase
VRYRALPRLLRHAIERHRMQAETDLIRTHQMQFKDEFLSHVSHELRSPLTAIYQFVTILQDGLAGELNLDQRNYLDIALRNVKQLQFMIDDLLEVTRMQAGKLTIEPQTIQGPHCFLNLHERGTRACGHLTCYFRVAAQSPTGSSRRTAWTEPEESLEIP